MCIRDRTYTSIISTFHPIPFPLIQGNQTTILPILWYLTTCLLYTSDAADERSSVDLGGRRIIKKKKKKIFFFFQAEDGIRDAQESRGLGDVYKRQLYRGTKQPSSQSCGTSP